MRSSVYETTPLVFAMRGPQVPQVCKAFFTDPDRMVRNEQATNCIWLTRPKLTTTWAAGFAFNKVRGGGSGGPDVLIHPV